MEWADRCGSAPAARLGPIQGNDDVGLVLGLLTGRTTHVQGLGEARRKVVHARILGRRVARSFGTAERKRAELESPEAVLKRVQKLLDRHVGDRDLVPMRDAGPREPAPFISGVLRHLRPKPSRRRESLGLLPTLELDADQIEHAGRDEAVEHRFPVGSEPNPRAFIADFASADREERFGLGARNFGPLFFLEPIALRGGENKKRVSRLDAYEVIPIRAGREVTLDHAIDDAPLLADKTGQGRCDKKAAFWHGTPLLSIVNRSRR